MLHVGCTLPETALASAVAVNRPDMSTSAPRYAASVLPRQVALLRGAGPVPGGPSVSLIVSQI